MSESLLAKESQPLPPPYTAITSFYRVEIISKSSEYLLIVQPLQCQNRKIVGLFCLEAKTRCRKIYFSWVDILEMQEVNINLVWQRDETQN